MRLITLSLGAAVAASTPAAADTYQYIAKDDENAAIFLDESTVVDRNNYRDYWIVSINGNYIAGKRSPYAYYLMRQTIDCANQTMRPTDMSVYRADGARVTSDSKGGERGSIEPGTIEQQIFAVVCTADANPQAARVEADSPLQLSRKFKATSREYLRAKR